jgi:hypothetical protein
MQITSKAFGSGQDIPAKFTCDGENINPSLDFTEIPQNAKSLVLIVEDPDAPNGTFTHWIMWGIKPGTIHIDQDSVPINASEGKNDFGERAYGGPCPPKGDGAHRYIFRLFALDTDFALPAVDTKTTPSPSTEREEMLRVIEGHVLEEARLTGKYERK